MLQDAYKQNRDIFDYDIAISFAGEDRAIAKTIAEKLLKKDVKIFYDEYEQANLWGKNLYSHLSEIYSQKAQFCLMIISSHYATKLWTNHERKAAQAKAFQENEDYILPLRVDDTEIPGLLPTVAFIDLRRTSIDNIVVLLQQKLKQKKRTQVNNEEKLTKYDSTKRSTALSQFPLRPTRILFLAANPTNSTKLRLDEEIRAVDLALRLTEFRDKFEIKQHWAVRVSDIQSYLLRHKPDIVHFSGHGNNSSEIILEDNVGKSHSVSVRALSQIFSLLKDNIQCVVLNACYSEQQAQAIAKYIDCVVGMSTAIGDKAAISFATAFYQALGYGKDVKTAFGLGCAQIDLENLNEQDTPKLLSLEPNSEKIVFVND